MYNPNFGHKSELRNMLMQFLNCEKCGLKRDTIEVSTDGVMMNCVNCKRLTRYSF